MRLLLDTHAFLWAVLEPEMLSRRAREAVEDLDNRVAVSAVNALEIAIKGSIGKLPMPPDGPERLREAASATRFVPLPVTVDHAFFVRGLPPHHGDPFDRLLVAQAMVERMTLVSNDRLLRRYDVDVLW